MKLLLLFCSIFSFTLFGQQVAMEDFKCATGAATPAGGVTTISCLDANGNPQAHGFTTGMNVLIWGATGNWKPMNTQTLQLLKMVATATGTTMYLNDTGMLENTPGSTYQIFPETSSTVCMNYPASLEQVTLNSIVDSRMITVTRGAAPMPHCNDDFFWGPLNRSNTWAVTVTDSTHFTIPLDSSTFGSFSGQAIHINRSSAYNGYPVPILRPTAGDGSSMSYEVNSSNSLQFVIDGCPNKTNAIRCSFAYNDPFSSKGYGDQTTTGSLVVSGGTGTLTLGNWAANLTKFTRTLQAGELCWLWNFSNPQVNRPWVVSSVSGSPSSYTVTFNNMGAGQGGEAGWAGVPDGTYPVTGSDLGGISFYFPIFADFYVDWVGLGNQSNYPTEWPFHDGKGAYNTSMNHFQAWFCWGGSMTGIPLELGTYVYDKSTWGNHGYHSINIDTYGSTPGCQWQLFETTQYPQHWVSGGNFVPQGADSTYTGYAGPGGWSGISNHYFDITERIYFNLTSIPSVPGAQTGYQGPMYMTTAPAEPEEWASTRTVSYNPSTGKYHLQVVSPPTAPSASLAYKFYYASSDIKTIGLSAATADGTSTAVNYGEDPTFQVNHDSAALPLQNTYFAVVPVMPPSGVSGNGQSPIILSFRSDPNMAAGDHITVAGVGGNTNANCTNCQITNVYPRRWLFRLAPAFPTPTVAGPLTSIVVTGGNTCTVNLTVAPGVVIGQEIGITGAPTGAIGVVGTINPAGMTWFNVTGVSGNSFTFSCPGSTNGTYNTDSGGGNYMAVVVDPAIGISGTGNANWDGQFTGTMVTSENNKNFAEMSFLPPSTSTTVIAPPASTSPCDVNGDGVVNQSDVTFEIQASMAPPPCATSLQQNGTCSVIDVRRIENYIVNGGTCQVGP